MNRKSTLVAHRQSRRQEKPTREGGRVIAIAVGGLF